MKKVFSILITLALVLSFSLVATTPVGAATPIYVDAARPNDSGDGTSWATAKKTITAGIGAVDIGGTVIVKAGTYSENVVINKQLTLQADTAGAIVDAGATLASAPKTIGINIAASGTTVDGMEVINARGQGSAGIAVSGNTRGVSIINCTVHDANSGINLYETGDGATNLISDNIVYDIYADIGYGGCGIIAWGDSAPCNDTTITDNEVYNTQRWSIALGSDAVAPCVDNVISGNNIHDNNPSTAIGVGTVNAINNYITDNDISDCQIGIGLNKASNNNDISGNTIVDNELGVGFYTASGLGSDGNALEDNTISSNTWQGVYVKDSDDNEIVGNTITDNWVGIHCDVGSDGTIIDGNTVSSNNPINIYLTGASTDTTITCNTISLAGWGGIQFFAGCTGVVHKNNIEGNPVGLWNDDTGATLVDAENNWWGDDSGPYHWSTNPTATGDAVTDNVDYTPWIDNSVTTATATGTASFASSEGNIVGLTAVLPPAPPPVTLPHGMFDFTICCLTGPTATLGITFPDAIPMGYKWWKYVGGSWYYMDIGSDDGDNFITVTLQDDVIPDDEDTVPGQITDQGGPGPGPGGVGWETYAVSKVRVLLPWIVLGAAIIVGASLLVLRRRRARS